VRECFLANAKQIAYEEKAFWLPETLKQDVQSSVCSFHLWERNSASNRRGICLYKICNRQKA